MQHQSQPLFLFSSFNNISSSLTSPSKWKECFNKGRAAQTYFLENLLKQHRITLSLTQNSRHAFLSSFVFLTPISISPLHLHIFTYTEQSHSTFLCTKTSKKKFYNCYCQSLLYKLLIIHPFSKDFLLATCCCMQ